MRRGQLDIPIGPNSWADSTTSVDSLTSAWAETEKRHDVELESTQAEIAQRITLSRIKARAMVWVGFVVAIGAFALDLLSAP